MIGIVVVTALFVVMFAAPFAGAMVYCAARDAIVLPIEQNRIRDARYFGKAFAGLIEENLPQAQDGRIALSKKETYINADLQVPNQERIEALVICLRRDHETPDFVREYQKEIYTAHNLYAYWKRIHMRAAYAGASAFLGAGTIVDRWVDANETLFAAKDCSLGMSASAGERLWIGDGCTFRRLYAPVIAIGAQHGDMNFANPVAFAESVRQLCASPEVLDQEKIIHLQSAGKPQQMVKNIRYLDPQCIEESGVARVTVVTDQNLVVLEHMIVQGDIRSHRGVRICDHAFICGNIFAEEDIMIGIGVIVLGNVFTQGNIVVERGAVIGQPGQIHSMVARGNIYLEENVIIYGFVSCEGGGFVSKKEQIEAI